MYWIFILIVLVKKSVFIIWNLLSAGTYGFLFFSFLIPSFCYKTLVVVRLLSPGIMGDGILFCQKQEIVLGIYEK